MSWRVATSLNVLLEQLNDAAPNRNKISDGSIGDAAHASRSSDHNPWVVADGVGVVRARDFTHDPSGGLDCNRLAERLADIVRAGSHPAARSGAYIIWNRRIFSYDRRAEGWRSYTGSNPHSAHLHLSVSLSRDGYDSGQRWELDNEPKGLIMDNEVKAAFDRLQKQVDDLPAQIVKQLLNRDLFGPKQDKTVAEALRQASADSKPKGGDASPRR